MKLNYDRKAKDPTYFVQLGIRNGKKTTTKNIARIGKHSELLKITDDPLAYAKEQVKKYNEEYKKKNNNISLDIQINLTEKIKVPQEAVSKAHREMSDICIYKNFTISLISHPFLRISLPTQRLHLTLTS